MHKPMRRADKQMTEEQVIDLLNRGEYGVLSTVDENNVPYGTPLSYVYLNDALYFHCAQVGTKLDNIKNNDKVGFTVVGKTKVRPEIFSTDFESVMVFGRAIRALEEEKAAALRELIKKYSPEFAAEGDAYIERAKGGTMVIKIEILNKTGKVKFRD